MMNEKCLDCKWCEIIEYGCKGFLGESLFNCYMCEEDTENKDECFEEKLEEKRELTHMGIINCGGLRFQQ